MVIRWDRLRLLVGFVKATLSLLFCSTWPSSRVSWLCVSACRVFVSPGDVTRPVLSQTTRDMAFLLMTVQLSRRLSKTTVQHPTPKSTTRNRCTSLFQQQQLLHPGSLTSVFASMILRCRCVCWALTWSYHQLAYRRTGKHSLTNARPSLNESSPVTSPSKEGPYLYGPSFSASFGIKAAYHHHQNTLSLDLRNSPGRPSGTNTRHWCRRSW